MPRVSAVLCMSFMLLLADREPYADTILRPRRSCFPNFHRYEPDFPVERVGLSRFRRVIGQVFSTNVSKMTRAMTSVVGSSFSKGDNPLPIPCAQFRVGRVGGIDAYRMIQGFKIIADELLHDQKVAHHLVTVEMFSFEDELHFARMAMRKFAFAGMLREHVAAFDIDCLANAIWHFGQQIDLPSRGKCNFYVPMMTWKQTSPGNDLQEGEVHVWRVGLEVSEPALGRFAVRLSEDEMLRSERFQLCGSAAPLCGGPRSLAGDPRRLSLRWNQSELKFGYTAHGKPFLVNSPADIQFNVSHSGDLMVAAFCNGLGIGVDIEKEDRQFGAMEIAERFFCDREKEEIARKTPDERAAAFFQIWTAKEAILKATSLGLALELSEVEIGLAPLRVVGLEKAAQLHGTSWQLVAFRPGESYRGTLAGAALPSQLDYRDFLLPS